MKKRFIVSLQSSTKEQNDLFHNYLESNKVGWWHWFADTWLIVDQKGDISADSLVNELGKSHPNIHCLVHEVPDVGVHWAGFGPASENRNMFKWLRETWDR